jgi:phage gpG-like protein
MIAVSIDGDVRVIRRLDEAIAAVGSPMTALEEIGDVILKEIDGNFEDEGRRLTGKKWVSLKPATIRQRLRSGYEAGPILNRSGDLRGSFSKAADDRRVIVWSGHELFAYHQLGMGHNPKRVMLRFSETMKQEIVAVFTKFIHEALSGRKPPSSKW